MIGKRELILEAALKQFAEVGYDKATMQSIAKRAGVGKGTTYEYFPSKEALFMEVISSRLNEILNMFKAQIQSPGPVREKIERLYAKYAELYDTETDLKKILSNDLGHIPKQYHDYFKKKHIELIEAIATVIHKGIEDGEIGRVDSNLAATVITASMSTLAVYAETSSDDVSATIPAILDILFHGLAANRES